MMEIRRAIPEDAADFIELNEQLEQESRFMLFEPGERKISVQQQEASFLRHRDADTVAVFVAVEEQKIVGFAGVTRFEPRRISRCARLVLGVLKTHYRRGIGSSLLNAVENWSRALDITRLELTVVEHNLAAISLYRKCGFEVEGLRRNALWINGEAVNELYMAKLLR